VSWMDVICLIYYVISNTFHISFHVYSFQFNNKISVLTICSALRNIKMGT
jgi:hypothetical protein